MEASPYEKCVNRDRWLARFGGAVAGVFAGQAYAAAAASGFGEVLWGSILIGGAVSWLTNHVMVDLFEQSPSVAATTGMETGIYGFSAYLVSVEAGSSLSTFFNNLLHGIFNAEFSPIGVGTYVYFQVAGLLEGYVDDYCSEHYPQ
jgi:hypothetical protein